MQTLRKVASTIFLVLGGLTLGASVSLIGNWVGLSPRGPVSPGALLVSVTMPAVLIAIGSLLWDFRKQRAFGLVLTVAGGMLVLGISGVMALGAPDFETRLGVSRSRFLSAILINGVVFGGAFLALGVRLLKQKQSNAKV